MIRNRIFPFGRAIFLAFLAISAAACDREVGLEEYRGNIGPRALDLTRKQGDEKSARPSPGNVWISLRPGNALLVKGWSEECINEAEPAYVVTNKSRASFRIPFVPADKNHMDFSFALKCISRGQTGGDEEKPLPITILFNNRRIGVFYVKKEWDDFTFEIPADWFHMGSNYFIFVLHNR